MDRDNTDAALAIAACGFRIVPLHTMDGAACDCTRKDCASAAKHPRITNWPKEASTDPGKVTRWFTQWPAANIGIATGAESGCVVIDIDPRNGGDETIRGLVETHGLFPQGPVAYTGGAGWHYYFKHPGGKVLSRSIAPGVDVKGDGGQVVAPPSFHASGNQYEWTETGTEYPLPDLPDWLLLMVKSDHDEGMSGYKRPVVGTIAEGKRNETLLSLGGTMRRRGFGQEAIFRALSAENEERCAPALDRTVVAQIAASVARYEPEEGIAYSSGKAAAATIVAHNGKRAPVQPRTLTFRELQGKAFPPPKMAVTGLMPVGLCLLCGRLKLGKSWLMLGVSIAIAEGGIALGGIPVEDGDVLYIAYEDHEPRLQSRGLTLLGDAPWPDRLYLAPTGCWPRRDDGGLEAIDAWLGAHPNARMVVIDTLQRFRGGNAGEGDKNAYAADYQVSADLQELAMKHEVVIVAVHHYRKSLSETDWVDQISGTNGIAGAADTLLGFERQRGEQTAILRVTGRDVEEQELALAFDVEKYGWFISGTAADARLSAEAKEFTAEMWEIGRGHAVHTNKLAEALGKKRKTIAMMGRRLADRGIIRSLGDGLWAPLSLVSPALGIDGSDSLPLDPPVAL